MVVELFVVPSVRRSETTAQGWGPHRLETATLALPGLRAAPLASAITNWSDNGVRGFCDGFCDDFPVGSWSDGSDAQAARPYNSRTDLEISRNMHCMRYVPGQSHREQNCSGTGLITDLEFGSSVWRSHSCCRFFHCLGHSIPPKPVTHASCNDNCSRIERCEMKQIMLSAG